MNTLLQNVKTEYKKVVWPSKDEIVKSTLLVAAMSVAVSIYVGAFDVIASRILKMMGTFFGG
ncbi:MULTISPECIES: preprotein translocase subunit SecE [Psychrilyobacter]|uniref:Preprotein translocase subunit SecE n=1 Tax=Psychrilyobacter piezotolerans TaxID=2293438 RepID=A0ABX9KDU7_9FUSO|nr:MULTISPECIES: preprotein translocase subunit SecE [Psychrilyobacter]MCS5422712.1 preprotein translocase subunit SecE [Psychrilyobacter sp. S5]NDI78982.1 preprotein translocase subunit SecE [Psychrilyobacter piezotolerans]RDE59203.1 preprotein translocase subunit SecE [Psychrilyobacter sp. S5]REI39770.1 preprotein translocase subunit SecE [Psychrilyobacter piezotolerans]